MPTRCLVKVTELRTEAVNGRERYLKKNIEKHLISTSHADVRHMGHMQAMRIQ